MIRPGAYVLLIHLERDATIEVGRIGSVPFEAGAYAYVGSAMGGLDARVARHLRTEKRIHWHIDYLLEHGAVTEVLEFESTSRIECALSEAVAALDRSSTPVPGFGSSDCTCRAHLYRLGPDAEAGADLVRTATRTMRSAAEAARS